jgi:hypothetical protein
MLHSLPLLTLAYDHEQDEVVVENDGSGAAVNIAVDSFYNWWADKDINLYGLTIVRFGKITLLKHSNKAILRSEIRGVSDPFHLTKFIMFSSINQKPLRFAIRFSDLTGTRYITIIRITSEGPELEYSPRMYGISAHAKLALMRTREAITMAWYFLKVNYRKYADGRRESD